MHWFQLSVTLHVSVWVVISVSCFWTGVIWSRSTWACELKYASLLIRKKVDSHAPRERVSWNGYAINQNSIIPSHAPRERVSWNAINQTTLCAIHSHAPRERVSWNYVVDQTGLNELRHAPRERVSWNCRWRKYAPFMWVTLHVSVWVEINYKNPCEKNLTSRSTWACELKSPVAMATWPIPRHAPRERVSWNAFAQRSRLLENVTLHVSVWVEITIYPNNTGYDLSRSTWACELKFFQLAKTQICFTSRSTWACELKWKKIVATLQLYKSRSTWACELKFSHWVINTQCVLVTLHVSVWVEMSLLTMRLSKTASRSTWACELK